MNSGLFIFLLNDLKGRKYLSFNVHKKYCISTTNKQQSKKTGKFILSLEIKKYQAKRTKNPVFRFETEVKEKWELAKIKWSFI